MSELLPKIARIARLLPQEDGRWIALLMWP